MSERKLLLCITNESPKPNKKTGKLEKDVVENVRSLIHPLLSDACVFLLLNSVSPRLEEQILNTNKNIFLDRFIFVGHGLKDGTIFICCDEALQELPITHDFFITQRDKYSLGFFFSCHGYKILTQENWRGILHDWVAVHGALLYNGYQGDSEVDADWEDSFLTIHKELIDEMANGAIVKENLSEYFYQLYKKYDSKKDYVNTSACFFRLYDGLRSKSDEHLNS